MKKRLPIYEYALLALTAALVLAILLLPGPEPGLYPEEGEAAERPEHLDGEGRLNINAATADELELLPGIGPVRAQAVIELRESLGGFESEYELLAVPGIGVETIAELADYICLEDDDEDTGG